MKQFHSLIYILLLVLTSTLTSCVDELLYDNPVIGEGNSNLRATVEYHAFESAIDTRSPGNSVDKVESLWVVLFKVNSDGSTDFFRKVLASGTQGYHVDQTGNGNDPTDAPTGENISASGELTPKADFKLTDVPYGKYKIYAVANVTENDLTKEQWETEDGLRSKQFEWNTDVTKDNQMFGYFTSSSNPTSQGFEAPTIVVNAKSVDIHAWIKRLVSKVTVSYDGSDLKDGVTIYIKSVSLKKIPKNCFLGKNNTVNSNEGYIENGEKISYDTNHPLNESYPGRLTKNTPFFPRKSTLEDGSEGYTPDGDPHSNTANSLFFFENMQGTGPDKQQKDENKDGILDEKYEYGAKPYATYIEVEAYYESVNPERPGISDIVYRFMLGKDLTTDYNAERNYHYKLTLHFNGFANEPDWRIDYVNFLGVSQPEIVDYRGKYFEPNMNYVNFGHEYGDHNIITVNSYYYDKMSWDAKHPVNYKIEYREGNGSFIEWTAINHPSWFTLEEVQTEAEAAEGTTKYKINYSNPYQGVILNTLLQNTTASGVTDLANGNSANSYIVSKKATYTIPLVYGNALVGGSIDASTYTSGTTGDRILTTFKNYLNKDITSGYILDDIKACGISTTGLDAYLVWEDVEGLIDLPMAYDATLYGGKGGIRFTVGNNIAEGNAVIAIRNAQKEIMWSWHIWVTSFDFSKTVQLTSRRYIEDKDAYVEGNVYDIMPINLGWKSNGGEVRYYDRHECELKFTQNVKEGEEGYSQTIKVIQEPHIAIPAGNNTYYQWGRKDPFIGTNASWTNSPWWYQNPNGTNLVAKQWPWNPTPLYGVVTKDDGTITEIKPGYLDSVDPTERSTTKDNLGLLIQHPNVFNNTKFSKFSESEKVLGDEIFSNLWSNTNKTVYDPCPYGYKVSPKDTFTGFTFNGDNVQWNSTWPTWKPPVTEANQGWFNVSESNMLPGYSYSDWLLGFYSNNTKLISLDFPLSGYLDYDAVEVYYFNNHGYIWTAENVSDNYSIFFKYCLDLNGGSTDINACGLVGPISSFYQTDGCSIRPTKM